MEKLSQDEGLLTRYLLGELTEEENTRVEERYFADDSLHDELGALERDLIDRYVQGNLSDSERERFENHFLTTPKRQERLVFARALNSYIRKEADKSEPLPVTHKRAARGFSIPFSSLKVAATIIILLGLAFGIYRALFYSSQLDKGLVALNRAYENQRPFQARISGTGYKAQSITRGNEQKSADKDIDIAVGLLAEAVVEEGSPAAHQALGKAYLMRREFDRAVDELTEAVRVGGANAGLYNDLGAALLERGKSYGEKDGSDKAVEDFSASLAHLSKAFEMDSSLLEALFNRALCYKALNYNSQAEADWRAYLDKDPDSEWAREARENLESIERQKAKASLDKNRLLEMFFDAFAARDDKKAWEIISQNREAITGKLIWWQLTKAFLDQAVEGREQEAGRTLQALLYAGQLEADRTPDRFTLDLANYYKSSSPVQRKALARAHDLADQGHRLCLASNFNKPIPLYLDAKRIFESSGDEWEAMFVDYWISYCYSQDIESARGLPILEDLLRRCEEKHYEWLLEIAFNSLATIREGRNEYSMALECTARALKSAELVEDTYGIQKNLAQLAMGYRVLHNYHLSLSYIHRCLSLSNKYWPGARQMWRNYNATARALSGHGFYVAAVDFAKGALRMASEEIRDPLCIYSSLLNIGIIYGNLKNFPEALRHAELGLEVVRTIPNQRKKLDGIAYSLFQLGQISRQAGDFTRALAYYNQAIEIYDDLSFQVDAYEAHKGRLLCLIALGNDSSAAEEIRTVVHLSEANRSKILEDENKNTFFDIEQSVYDAAIDFEYSRSRDSVRAFEYSEFCRSRSLLYLMNAEARNESKGDEPETGGTDLYEPLNLATIRERLPKKAQIVQYAVLDGKILIWVISSNGFYVEEVKVDLDTLNERVKAYSESLADAPTGKKGEARELSKWLYGLLIAPVESSLDKAKLTCIVPDKILNRIPFHALISPASNRYLISDYLLEYAPSSSVFIICSGEARTRGEAIDERLLSVGNPRWDLDLKEGYGSLPDLPSSKEEAEDVARYYNSPRCLTGPDATEGQVKNEMELSEVIQLATHYLIDERSPTLSKLLLAKETGADGNPPGLDGVLEAREINDMKLSRARLVVLSACQTGGDRPYNGEGMIGMSRTFLAKRVPLVVASLWRVESRSTAELMTRFHMYRKCENLPTSRALRKAQLDMIKNSDSGFSSPYYWAPFITIGGYACY